MKGMDLTVMVGPAVPVPLPRAVLDASSVEVTTPRGSAAVSGCSSPGQALAAPHDVPARRRRDAAGAACAARRHDRRHAGRADGRRRDEVQVTPGANSSPRPSR